MLDRLRLITAWIASLLYWIFGGTGFLLLCLLLPVVFNEDDAKMVGQSFLRTAFRGFLKLLSWFEIVECEYVGFERLKDQQGGMIVAPNHPALWDAVFVLAEVDHMACVLKASLMCNPILFGGATAAGFIPNEPTHKMLRQCIDMLKGGGRLLFFPEGTRTRAENGELNPFQGGLALVAKNAGVPVWPVYVKTNSRYLNKGWPLWRLPTEKVSLSMTVGEPLHFPANGDPQTFLNELRQCYLTALKSPAA
ncbi:1-acyl-sn-glycerol-3-phosphate acyltransferase [Prosthecobacter fusiformis]|uniref:1-acyl-sn-glycerol-3-phosphate acyltransferase n=2 Tax=Prosthecobacter fusiformis TaxID=48464 RepID=A0A4R7SU29_9BACT|nr:1-acyl-sn-glycerol-3-phosphate acyltransferase [Prosthecobacter fusiformis]